MNKGMWSALALAALAGAREAQACAVCFGAGEGNQGIISGLAWGIVVLLGTTGLLLASFVVAVRRLEAQKRAHDSP